ncbi:MAG: YicC family protein [Ruminococcaceae bacterium]|nr:YicC family protein [Oscillospiraceae bacterium]
MAYSMTGFGRGEKVFDTRKYSVELKSVNSRFCDINIRLPRLFNFAEVEVRKIITAKLVRGKIDCYINYDDTDGAGQTVTVNAGLAKAYSEAAKVLAEVSGRDDNFNATNLAGFQDVLSIEQRTIDEARALEELTETLNMAIDGMLAMRKREGDALCENILSKVDNLEKLRNDIAEHAPSVIVSYRERLTARIDEILSSDQRAFYDDNRLAAEVAVFADKCAIDEELTRLASHIAQARKILSGDGSVGKQMDFLIQEINREVNTTGSKANDIDITNNVLLCKNIVEEMREQVQNLV